MHFLCRTLLMAVCLMGALAIPKHIQSDLTDENSKMGAISLLVAQMRSALIDMRALTPAQTNCATQFNNRTQKINNILTNQTNACYENANRTLIRNNKYANRTVTNIRNNLEKVQKTLANCTSISDVPSFLNCTKNSFDNDIHLLDMANSQAYQMETQINANQSQVGVVYRACVSAVIGSGKTNLTQAANDYQSCLSNTSNQNMWMELN